jgi:hypothetical protein
MSEVPIVDNPWHSATIVIIVIWLEPCVNARNSELWGLTVFADGSTEYHNYGSLQLGQTIKRCAVHVLLCHWQTHWSAIYKAVQRDFQGTQNPAHHGYLGVSMVKKAVNQPQTRYSHQPHQDFHQILDKNGFTAQTTGKHSKNLPWKVNLISLCCHLTIYVLSDTNLGNKYCITILVDGPMVSAGLYLIMPLNCKLNLNSWKNCKHYLSLTRRQHCKTKSFNFSETKVQ